jgi:4-diphosphocytidyl-2-C-methyl-D-erythritol kinase
MRIVCDHDGVTAFAPAKLNLFLEVLGKRPDGYHELETLMAAVDLCDTLHLAPRTDDSIILDADWATADRAAAMHLGDIPTGAQNIVVRALDLLRERAGARLGATVRLRKRIPSAAGLGGASSDAAAALLAANVAWGLHWSRAQLSTIAAELGSDVPFFLGAPAAVCRGRGEIIEPLESTPTLDVVVVRPPIGLSTPAVFRECSPAASPMSVLPLADAWQRGDLRAMGQRMMNRLEPAAAKLSPWIARLRDAFCEQGCYGYQMTGSGSSYFGICRSALHARRVAERLRAGGLGVIYRTRTIGYLKVGHGERAA